MNASGFVSTHVVFNSFEMEAMGGERGARVAVTVVAEGKR